MPNDFASGCAFHASCSQSRQILNRARSHPAQRLMDRGQRWPDDLGNRSIVEASNGNVLGNAKADFVHGKQGTRRHIVIGADQGINPVCRLQQILSAIQTGPKSEISPARFNGGFAKSRLRQRGKKPVIAGLSRSVALQTLDETEPLVALPQKVHANIMPRTIIVYSQ